MARLHDYREPNQHESWREHAACRNIGREAVIFFPEDTGRYAIHAMSEAIRMCNTCPVQMECLAYAIATREEHGIWGGKLPEERRIIRRRLDGTTRHGNIGA